METILILWLVGIPVTILAMLGSERYYLDEVLFGGILWPLELVHAGREYWIGRLATRRSGHL